MRPVIGQSGRINYIEDITSVCHSANVCEEGTSKVIDYFCENLKNEFVEMSI